LLEVGPVVVLLESTGDWLNRVHLPIFIGALGYYKEGRGPLVLKFVPTKHPVADVDEVAYMERCVPGVGTGLVLPTLGCLVEPVSGLGESFLEGVLLPANVVMAIHRDSGWLRLLG
jgi:hypothetical protein